MFVRDVMTPGVDWVDPATCITETARMMRDAGADCLPVGRADRLVGMVTDVDIACRAIADGRDPATTPVAEVMSRGAPRCFDDQEPAASMGDYCSAVLIQPLPHRGRPHIAASAKMRHSSRVRSKPPLSAVRLTHRASIDCLQPLNRVKGALP